jgi:hypothetical protein
MPKRFLITDDAGVDYGVLSYEPETRAWHIEVNPERTWDDTPLSLALYIRNGIYSLDERQSLDWVRDRLLPPNRQNIHHILRALDLPAYDEYALILHTNGVSANDSLYLQELGS